MDKPEKLDIRMYGARNFPIAQVAIPTHLLEGYQEMFAAAQAQYPAATHSDLIRYIFRAGIARTRDTILKGKLPDLSKIPLYPKAPSPTV